MRDLFIVFCMKVHASNYFKYHRRCMRHIFRSIKLNYNYFWFVYPMVFFEIRLDQSAIMKISSKWSMHLIFCTQKLKKRLNCSTLKSCFTVASLIFPRRWKCSLCFPFYPWCIKKLLLKIFNLLLLFIYFY